MPDLLSLAEMESDDSELVPEIFAVDARLSISGEVEKLIPLFVAAVGITPVKEVLPNTSYVLLESFDATASAVSYAQLSSTDGDRSLTVIEDSLKVHLAGSALLPGKKILDILRLANTPVVRLDVFGNTATIRSGRAMWNVQTPVGNNLPPFADTSDIELYPVDRKSFLWALESVHKAAAKSSARMSLMQAEVKQGKITTCDSARVHRVVIPDLPKSVKTTLPMNLIESAIKELKALEEETFMFGSNNSTVVFHLGRNILRGQRLTLEYPNVDHLMLEPAMLNTEELHVNVADLASAVKRVRVNADPDFFAVSLSIRSIKGVWNLIVRARDKTGNASQEILTAEYAGPDVAKEIVLNHKFLSDFLDVIKSEQVVFKLGQSTKTKQAPIYVSDGDFVGVLMPMSPNVVKV